MATFGTAGIDSNPYARLGLAPGSSLADVKRAYRRLAMHFHPDHAGSGSLPTFMAVKTAYEWIVAHQPRAGLRPSSPRPGVRADGRTRRPARATRCDTTRARSGRPKRLARRAVVLGRNPRPRGSGVITDVNRILVGVRWAWSLFTVSRGSRLIMG